MKIYQTRLFELRTDKDLRQEDIAKIISCTKQAYGNYENGKRALPLEQLVKLCNFYGVSADYILGLPKGMKYPER